MPMVPTMVPPQPESHPLLPLVQLLLATSAARQVAVLGAPEGTPEPAAWCAALATGLPKSGRLRWWPGEGVIPEVPGPRPKGVPCDWQVLANAASEEPLDGIPGSAVDALLLLRSTRTNAAIDHAARVLRPRGILVAHNRFAFPRVSSQAAPPGDWLPATVDMDGYFVAVRSPSPLN